MGKMHKEIAKYLVQAGEDEDTNDENIIKVNYTDCILFSENWVDIFRTFSSLLPRLIFLL